MSWKMMGALAVLGGSVFLALGFEFNFPVLTVGQLFERMDQAWSKITDYQGNLRLSARSLHDNQEDVFTGTLRLKPPERLLMFRYQQELTHSLDPQPIPGQAVPAVQPVSGIYLGVGDRVSKYNDQDKTVEHTLRANDQFILLLGLLSGMGAFNKDEFLKRHEVNFLQRDQVNGVGAYRFQAALKPEYRKVEGESVRQAPINWNQILWVHQETFLPMKAQLVIPNEREITIMFTEVRINPQITLDSKDFRLPDQTVNVEP